MFILTKQVFYVLLCITVFYVLLFYVSREQTKCLFLNDKPCMVPTVIDLNPLELNYYPFMISLDKCTGS